VPGAVQEMRGAANAFVRTFARPREDRRSLVVRYGTGRNEIFWRVPFMTKTVGFSRFGRRDARGSLAARLRQADKDPVTPEVNRGEADAPDAPNPLGSLWRDVPRIRERTGKRCCLNPLSMTGSASAIRAPCATASCSACSAPSAAGGRCCGRMGCGGGGAGLR